MTVKGQARTALVTGAAGGIGGSVVTRLLEAGWSVTAVDRSSTDADLDIMIADVSDVADRERIMAVVGDELGMLVNNAAIQHNQSIEHTSDETWSETLDNNLTAPFSLIRDLRRSLKNGVGSIVNVSSVHAFATSANVAAYAVSKAALSQLTRTVALEFAAFGVRCNAVAPGAVQTGMLIDGLSRREHPDGPDGNLEQLRKRTPLGVVARPEAIASVVEFLGDNRWSSYVTGQTLIADGGATLRLGTE